MCDICIQNTHLNLLLGLFSRIILWFQFWKFHLDSEIVSLFSIVRMKTPKLGSQFFANLLTDKRWYSTKELFVSQSSKIFLFFAVIIIQDLAVIVNGDNPPGRHIFESKDIWISWMIAKLSNQLGHLSHHLSLPKIFSPTHYSTFSMIPQNPHNTSLCVYTFDITNTWSYIISY